MPCIFNYNSVLFYQNLKHTTMQTFNANEVAVLKLLAAEMTKCTGGEFGFIIDCKKGQFNKNQFAGYISDLSAKECFEYLMRNERDGQFALTAELYKEYK